MSCRPQLAFQGLDPARQGDEKPAETPAGAPPSGPDAATANQAREGTLFHLLMERGWEAGLAYSADQRIRTMTSEIAAAGLQPVLAELRQMRASMATKAELRQMREGMAAMATKADLAEREARLIKWMFGAMVAQTAVIIGFVVGVVPLLK